MAEYKGGSGEGQRHTMLEKQREAMLSEFQKRKEQISKDNEVKIGSDRFVAYTESVEDQLKRDTVGLVTFEEFRAKREQLEKKRALESGQQKDELKPKKKKKKADKSKLSFAMDGEEEADEGSNGSTQTSKEEVGKNPDVDTSFLPDREREELERKERERLRKEWLEQQEIIKNEVINITYSFWDGTGHRKSVECRKGDTVSQFLEKVRQQWHELRGVTVDNLIYVKEDLIIPHHYTFYDFILNRVRGKSGPLFHFDVHDDVRLVSDARVETEESHAGKVCERSWYERNKHIFPASRWEIFDPSKNYAEGGYTIKDTKKNKT
ncbi:XAP5, circadian clock regulator-domain-containing protein [Paraphysoderma sedebokerense]|nr:XAP5, circadian clock regulator-domain-containing protein [Paraphysoderma sedebokerense]